MSGHNYSDGTLTLVSGEALAEHRVVKINTSKQAVYADAGERGIGVTIGPALTSGDPVTVKLFNNDGTFLIAASEAISAGAHVYQAADGKVSDTVTGCHIGMATEAASGDNSVIEVSVAVKAPQMNIRHVATAGEGTATEAVINTGLGIELNWAAVHVKTSAGVPRVIDVLTFGSGADAGKVTIGSAALATGDIIHGVVGANAVTL